MLAPRASPVASGPPFDRELARAAKPAEDPLRLHALCRGNAHTLSKTIAALTLLGLAGCAAPAGSWGEWAKAGVDASVQRRDEYQCQRQAVLRRGTVAATAALFAACMAARGYQRGG